MSNKDIKTELKETARQAKLRIMATFGSQSAQQSLQKQKEDKIIKQYFGDIKKGTIEESELRKYARAIQSYEEDNYEKNTKERLIQHYVEKVHSLASKKEFDARLNKNASFSKWIKTGENAQLYNQLQEYASFGYYAAIAYMDKDFLKQLDTVIEKSLNDKELAEYRKKYNGQSFTEIKQKHHNPQTANQQKKKMDNKTGEYWAGSYR